MQRTSRGTGNNDRAASLAELRALKQSGKKRGSTYQLKESEKVYDEVDEEAYKQVVRTRLLEEDFVVDDHGEGYADNGMDDWEQEQTYSSEEEELARPINGRKQSLQTNPKKEGANINEYFKQGPAVVEKPKKTSTAEDASFLQGILQDVDDNVLEPIAKKKKEEAKPKPVDRDADFREAAGLKKKTPVHESISKIKTELSSSSPLRNQYTYDNNDSIMDDELATPDASEPIPSPIVSAIKRKHEEVGDDANEFEVKKLSGRVIDKGTAINIAAVKHNIKQLETPPKPRPLKVESSPADAGFSPWRDVNDSLNVLDTPTTTASSFGKLKANDVAEDDGSVKMFWIDFCELNGILCLFGKVKVKGTQSYASCFLRVDGILRTLYFLPRKTKQKNGQDTGEEVEMHDVFEEVGDILSRFKVGTFKSKPCTRKYSFELADIPQYGEYLKLPLDVSGATFSRAFGTNTALFEQFVLCRKVMGPCWLHLHDVDFTSAQNVGRSLYHVNWQASWCKLEIAVSSPGQITPIADGDAAPPPLTLMSISLRTLMNQKENKQEIIVASARIYENGEYDLIAVSDPVSLNDPTPAEELPCQTFTVARPLKQIFPPGFEQEASKHRGSVRSEKTEAALLNCFLSKIQNVDPDVLMGHNFDNIDYSVLLHRMRDKKINNWHRIGRLRRSDWPKNFGRAGGFYNERQLASGRLLCDLSNELGKSLMNKCQSWSLTEMCELILGTKRQDIDQEKAMQSWTDTARGLLDYVLHAELDTHFIAAVALKVQILPLTKQLTNLAGNSWGRTLSGTRSERNEYILLHEFSRNKYICPDKVYGKAKPLAVEDDDDDDNGNTNAKKKDKYKGGLVFEPERGLYDKYILVMDFNSLYPSIIQEYNICFTTVDRSKGMEDEDEVPDPPSRDQAQGVLPRLISTLVQRRRQVKSLMKDKNATATQLNQWDTKQQALKLTANSMYGCLGYTKSRFYARPLAVLTTFKGREILMNTKELAESMQLQVIYGDTDSVMINTNADKYADAIRIGNEFKKTVNEKYRLLEIDIDNIFQRLLLHQKKKYAALSLIEVNGKLESRMEVKGLDMRRREFCSLSKEASTYVLNHILSGEQTETVVEKIHEYLRDLAQKVRTGEIPSNKFIIYTKLGKNPEDYPGGKNMPQVQVALRRKAKGESVRVNDVIAFIITSGESGSNPAERAYAPQEVLKRDSQLKPDFEWYLLKQIFPPIERLCAPIEGTDASRIGECLGCQVKDHHMGQMDERTAAHIRQPLESTISDESRFRECSALTLCCRHCRERTEFLGLIKSMEACTAQGVKCLKCGMLRTIPSINCQLEIQLRKGISKYYENWLVCDDPQCGIRTKQMNVYGRRCLGLKGLAVGCKGTMRYEYSSKALYTQLLYYDSLFDVDRAKANATDDNKVVIDVLAEQNRSRFENIRSVVRQYAQRSGRGQVDFGTLFKSWRPGMESAPRKSASVY